MKKFMAITATTALTCTFVGAHTTNAASTVKMKNNKLVYTKTGKIVKGYKVYQKKLYKNGVLAAGSVKYGKGTKMKLYKNGVLKSGITITKDLKYAFKNGTLIKGTYTYHANEKDVIFKNGVRTHLIEIKNGKLYDNGKLKTGKYVMQRSFYKETVFDGDYLTLFVNGKVATGYVKATYKNETYMFKDGGTGEFFGTTPFYYNGVVYSQGKPALKDTYVLCDDDKLYYNNQPFTGEYNQTEYKDGVLQYKTIQKPYELDLKALIALKDDITISTETRAQQFNEKTAILSTYMHEHLSELSHSYLEMDDVGSYDETIAQEKLVGDMQKLAQIARSIEGTESAQAQIEQNLKEIYLHFNLHYDNGQLLDGEINGNIYSNGFLENTKFEKELSAAYEDVYRAEQTFKNAEYKNKPEQAKAAVTPMVETLQVMLEKAMIVLAEHEQPTYENAKPSIQFATKRIQESKETLRTIENALQTYDVAVDLTPLQQTMEKAYTAIGEKISFATIDPSATYEHIDLSTDIDGQFDDNGYAYFSFEAPSAEGNYDFVGDTTFETNNVTLANSQEALLHTAAKKGNTAYYLKQGTYYVAVKGEPNAAYHFQLQKHQYNTDEQKVWSLDGVSKYLELPIYEQQQQTILVEVMEGNHLEFHEAGVTSLIDSITLKNTTTGEVYEALKPDSTHKFFTSDAPEGIYELHYTGKSNTYGQMTNLRWVFLPAFNLNGKANYSTSDYKLSVDKDTKVQFTFTNNVYGSSDTYFNIFNADRSLLKSFTLTKNEKTKTVTYTLKKGHYTINKWGVDVKTATIQ